MNRLKLFFKSETVLVISLVLALISSFFVHPDKNYVSYIDFRTLGLLFSLMTVTEGFKKSGILELFANRLISISKNSFQLYAVLVFLCFFTSMIITNDVALITFVPLAISVLKKDESKKLVPVVVLQTVAANLGSMFTPIGNPQNLFLFGISGMHLSSFFRLMLPFTACAAIMLVIWLKVISEKNKNFSRENSHKESTLPVIDKKRLVLNLLLFALCLLTVARIIDWKITCSIILALILITDKKLLKNVDYSLLLTFCGFFFFTGNMGRIDFFENFLRQKVVGYEIITSVITSQIISNVPCALLLSGFTDNVKALITGTNIGGLGTLIASMASLISFRQISRACPEKKKNYLGYFTIANCIFLLAMIIIVNIFK